MSNKNGNRPSKSANAVRWPAVTRVRDLTRSGVHSEYLRRAVKRGLLARRGRGVYERVGADVTEHHDFALAARAVSRGVICLCSALLFHNLTTQLPQEVWMAIDVKARRPKYSGVPMRFVRFGGKALCEGVEKHRIEGVTVKVYNVAKTVADCFKYRRKYGLDVAVEALREGWRERRFTVDELMRFARVCRVANVIRPYVEAIV
jgi:predicted transcriptional regulator of viral defense system